MPEQITGQDLINTARTYIGTPFHHAGRVKGVGVDCIGLLVCVAQELGFVIEDTLNYAATQDEYPLMVASLERYCTEISSEDASAWESGDVLVFRDRRINNHCALFVEGSAKQSPGMIHAYSTGGVNKVVEHGLDSNWKRRIAKVYRFREVL